MCEDSCHSRFYKSQVMCLQRFFLWYILLLGSALQAWLGSKATALAWHLGAQALLNMAPGPTPRLWGASASFSFGAMA